MLGAGFPVPPSGSGETSTGDVISLVVVMLAALVVATALIISSARAARASSEAPDPGFERLYDEAA